MNTENTNPESFEDAWTESDTADQAKKDDAPLSDAVNRAKEEADAKANAEFAEGYKASAEDDKVDAK